MGKTDIVVPDGMLKAAGAGSDGVDPCGFYLVTPLRKALEWLDTILHESNVDFHRAILKREAERYPEGTLTYQLQRVAFEFGASFARQYIRSLFAEPETTGVDAVTGKIIAEARQRAFDEIMACAKDEDIESGIGVDAHRVWALALQEREQKRDSEWKSKSQYIRKGARVLCMFEGCDEESSVLLNATPLCMTHDSLVRKRRARNGNTGQVSDEELRAEEEAQEVPDSIRHLICGKDGAWPPSRQLYNACIEDAYEIGKKEGNR